MGQEDRPSLTPLDRVERREDGGDLREGGKGARREGKAFSVSVSGFLFLLLRPFFAQKSEKTKLFFSQQDCFRAVTGLPVSPYFSAYKMLWLLENVPAVKKAAEEGRLAFGTVDSWLIFHLTGGSNSNRKGDESSCSSSSTPPASPTFVTDVTNASRTGLLCLKTRAWHLETCGKLGIDVAWLARIASSAEVYGKVAAPLSSSSENIAEMVRGKASLYRTCSGESGFVSGNPSSTSGNNKSSSDEATVVSWSCRSLAGVPISGCLGDQQAALLGQRCRVGEAKATYGTGAFVLLVTGSEAPVPSSSGLLTTAAYQLGADAPLFYALEGAVAVAGAGVSWLRDGFGIIERPQEVEELARSVEDSCGVVLVPAFAGLLAPRWRADARGVIVGLTSATTKAHLARAMLDAIGWQTKEVVEAMALDRSSAMGSKAEKGAAAASSAAEEESKTNSSPSSSVAAISRLRVDGGASRNDLLMEIQADLLGLPVERPAHGETTSLGAALAAGVGAGVFSSAEEAFTVGVGAAPSVFLPKAKREDVARAYEKWNDAVERSYGLAG